MNMPNARAALDYRAFLGQMYQIKAKDLMKQKHSSVS